MMSKIFTIVYLPHHKGAEVRGQDFLKGGGGQGASGGGDQTSSGIHRQEAGAGSGVGGPMENILSM